MLKKWNSRLNKINKIYTMRDFFYITTALVTNAGYQTLFSAFNANQILTKTSGKSLFESYELGHAELG